MVTYEDTWTEDQFQSWAIGFARDRGWKVFFFPQWAFRLAMASMKRKRIARLWPDKGFPDCIFLRDGRLVVVEFKIGKKTTKAGKPRPEQQEWLDALIYYGIPTYHWLPSDRRAIETVFSAPRRVPRAVVE